MPRADGPLAAKVAKTEAAPVIAIDDAIERVLPALAAATAADLKGPLFAISASLKSKTKNLAALNAAIGAARAALSAPLAANDEHAPDLTAIALAIDAVPAK